MSLSTADQPLIAATSNIHMSNMETWKKMFTSDRNQFDILRNLSSFGRIETSDESGLDKQEA